jgi:hypothetical protein
MKTSKLKLLALATAMVVSIHPTQAFDMNFGFDTSYQLILPGSTSTNGLGRVWLGNFGNNGADAIGGQIAGGVGLTTSLLSTFRPLTSFGVDSDGFFNGNGVGAEVMNGVYNASNYVLYGKIGVGSEATPGSLVYTSGEFAGQDAYLLVLNSYSDVWETAKSEWAASGTLASILVKSGSGFDFSDGQSSPTGLPGPKYYSVSPQGGTLMLGDLNGQTITASSVPEPSVSALLLVGGGALALIGARRNRE